MPFPWTNSLEKAATGENQKFHLVYSQWSVQTVGCWAVLSRGPQFVCPVLTHGSWPCSEADHQTGQTLVCPCNRSCVPVETKFIQSTSLSTGTCWSQCICLSQLHRSHEPTRLRGFWMSFSTLCQLHPFIFLFFFLSNIKNVSSTSCIHIKKILLHVVPWPQLW